MEKIIEINLKLKSETDFIIKSIMNNIKNNVDNMIKKDTRNNIIMMIIIDYIVYYQQEYTMHLKKKKKENMTINEAQDEVIEQFQDFSDWMDKYQLLIDLGGDLEPLDDKYKTEQNLIDGCQSRVWVQCDMTDDGRLVFTADSDALIVKGIIALLIQVISGHTPREILDADLYFIERIGLKDHLSPTRSNGLLAMVKQIRMYALAYEAKSNVEC